MGELSAEVLNPGDKAAIFTVQPKTGLQAGDHSDTISVTDQNTETHWLKSGWNLQFRNRNPIPVFR